MPRPDFLPFARPSITDTEVDGVVRVLRSGWPTTGPVTREFERLFAEYVGSRHAVAVNSATAALHLAMDALKVKQGDEVIVPTWTFAATAEVVAYSGATPVLVDVEAETLNASTETIAQAITARTKAVIVVHFAGLPVDMAAVDRVASAGVPVVEDAAHAFPSRLASGRLAGTIGRVGAYSFYATKTTTAEGGMLSLMTMRLPSGRGPCRSTASVETRGSGTRRPGPVLRDRGARVQIQHDRYRRRVGIAQLVGRTATRRAATSRRAVPPPP